MDLQQLAKMSDADIVKWVRSNTDSFTLLPEHELLEALLSRLGNVEELNNIKRESGRLKSENKALRDEIETFELAKYTKELAEIRESKIPIPRQIQRKKNQIERHQNGQEI